MATLTREKILKDFEAIFKRYPFKTTITVYKSTNNDYGNFFNIDATPTITTYDFEAIILNPQPGVVRNGEYRVGDEEFSLFVKPRDDTTITYDDEIEWNGIRFVITYIGGAVDGDGNRLWYEIRMKRK